LAPRGLWALLLVASAAALFPDWCEPVLQPARWLMRLPLRALPNATVLAGEPRPTWPDAEALLTRLDDEAVRPGTAAMAADLEPVVCRVLDRRVPRRAPGAAGLPTLLVLDRTWAEVGDCTGLVTRGDRLVGCIGKPSDVDDPAARSQAVVRCTHATLAGEPPRRFQAATTVHGAALRVVVEPGSRIDAWPLRISLLEDPYLAARLPGPGETVRTCAQVAAGIEVPAGLRLGGLRVWGYSGDDGPVLPVGFFVELPYDPRAIATVVLWRHREGARAAPGSRVGPLLHAARGLAMPGGRLYLVRSGADFAPGAAVLDRGGTLFGVVVDAGPGDALAAPFATLGKSWPLLLVPDDGRPPVECVGRVLQAAGGWVDLELARPIEAAGGEVYTAGHGIHCPAGLRVGRIGAVTDAGSRLHLERPPLDVGMVHVSTGGPLP